MATITVITEDLDDFLGRAVAGHLSAA